MRALNIKWDTDGNTDVLNELPSEVEIPYGIEEDEVCDYLSDEYGYCVFGFDIEENDGFKGLFIDGKRSGYAPNQCDTTMTINQLIEKLEELRDYHSAGNCPVFLYNDNGYTYGHINENTMNIGRYTETNGVEFEEECYLKKEK